MEDTDGRGKAWSGPEQWMQIVSITAPPGSPESLKFVLFSFRVNEEAGVNVPLSGQTLITAICPPPGPCICPHKVHLS